MLTLALPRPARHWVHAFVTGTGLLMASAVVAQPAADHVLVDRIVAVVDDEPLLWSDIERVAALDEESPVIPRSPHDPQARPLLERLIDQRLRLREVDRFATPPVAADEVERQLNRLRERFANDAAWHAQLDRVGLDEAGLRHQLQRQLRILRYVDQRLGPRVFVSPDEVQTYYDTTLSEALEADGSPVPPLDEVRQAIRTVIRQQRLNQEVETWTAVLREKATIVDLLDAPPRPLPPVLRRIQP